MPVTGRKPKPPGEAVNPNKPVHGWTEVENIPFTEGPSLPTERLKGEPWPARTRDKWDAWRTMPHAKLWTQADWDFALDSIELAARFHEGGTVGLATELRNRERVLGTTADFRRDLRIRYVEPKPVQLAAVVQADDFRDL